MQHGERAGHHPHKHLAHLLRGLLVVARQANLRDLDEPVAELIPQEVIQLLRGDTEFKFLQILVDFLRHTVEGGHNPLVLRRQAGGKLIFDLFALNVHEDKAGSVPQLIGKVAAGLHALGREAGIVSGADARHQREAQSVRAILGDDLQRIDAVAEGFAHLAALRVAHQSMEEHGLEGNLLHVLQTGEDHARHPEENDIVAGDESVRRIEIFQLLCLFRPAEGRERPKRRAEPGVQRILVLMQIGAAALRAGMRRFAGDNHLAAVRAVPRRDPVAPPQLTGNAPVFDIFHPVIIRLVHTLRNKLDLSVAHAVHRGLRQRLHLDEPLLGHARFDHRTAAVAGADIVLDVLNANEEALLLQIADDRLSGFQTAHAAVLAAILVDAAVLVHHVDDFKVVAQTDLEVVRVVGGGDLHDASSEILLHIGIGHDRNLTANQRQDQRFADDILITLVLRVHRDGGIAQHRLGTGRRQLQIAGAVLEGIAQVPEMTRLLLKFHLRVRNGGLAVRAPVDDALAAIDQALLIQTDKDLAHGLRAALVEREALPLPIAGGAELFQLLHDASAVLALPVPGAL